MEFEGNELAVFEHAGAVDAGTAPPERPDRRAPVNRRQHPRYQITTTADYMDVASGACGTARTSDISLGGCFMDTTSPYSPGTRLQLRLSREGRSFETLAEVVCAMPGMGMGVRFVQVAAEQLSVLEEWIGEISGAAPRRLFPPAWERSGPPAALRNEVRYVMYELIVLLMREGVVAESQGDPLLHRLHQAG